MLNETVFFISFGFLGQRSFRNGFLSHKNFDELGMSDFEKVKNMTFMDEVQCV